MTRTLVALAATAFTFVGSAAVAAPATVTHEATVNYADLNLESPAGIDKLYARLRTAARQVCGSAERSDLAASMYVAECRAKAVAQAVAKIDNPALTARHAGEQNARFAQVADAKRG
jgi:UrcA family protein